MSALTDIPVEIFLDNLFPLLQLDDLLNLGSINKFFAALCSDETFWKRKLQTDFNFSGAGTARTSGWKYIYRRLSNPRVFVWGARSHGRMGLTKFPRSTLRGDLPFPTELRFPGIRIVNLVAGGMSFHALDSDGHLHVWGTLDGTTLALTSDGFSESGKTAKTPLRLQLPVSMRSISCGRLHSASLDSANHIWTFLNWGRPFRLTSSILNAPDFVPIQVECGWSFSCSLMKSGDIIMWWPFSGQMEAAIEAKMREMDQEGDKKACADEGQIPCIAWDLDADPTVLPPLPALPDVANNDQAGAEPTRVIQIAGFDQHIIALTNQGHVLKFGVLHEISVSEGVWQYLPNFSEVRKVRTFGDFGSRNLEAPDVLKITHISAHFLNFFAYSTTSNSVVLMGNTNTTPDSAPDIIPGLQGRSVISVVLGDYHNAAVTSDGKLLTWGAFSSGALGLGDPAMLEVGTPGGFSTGEDRLRAIDRGFGTPPSVDVPTEVRFDHLRKKRKDRFCVSAAASGWHTGALVIDLEPNENDTDSDVEVEEEPAGNLREYRGTPPPPTPPLHPFIGRGNPHFRIGFAGRGMHRGG